MNTFAEVEVVVVVDMVPAVMEDLALPPTSALVRRHPLLAPLARMAAAAEGAAQVAIQAVVYLLVPAEGLVEAATPSSTGSSSF
jgi:hypothetical protein